MIFLYILLAVICLVVILLFIPAYIKIESTDDFEIIIKYLFFKHDMTEPEDGSKGAQAGESENSEDKLKLAVNAFKKLKELLSMLETLKTFLSRLVIKKIFVQIGVCGEDAANAAVNFGIINAAVYPVIGLITAGIKTKKADVRIYPKYNEHEWDFKVKIIAKFFPILVFTSLIKLIINSDKKIK